jgi:hypothetical protein
LFTSNSIKFPSSNTLLNVTLILPSAVNIPFTASFTVNHSRKMEQTGSDHILVSISLYHAVTCFVSFSAIHCWQLSPYNVLVKNPFSVVRTITRPRPNTAVKATVTINSTNSRKICNKTTIATTVLKFVGFETL